MVHLPSLPGQHSLTGLTTLPSAQDLPSSRPQVQGGCSCHLAGPILSAQDTFTLFPSTSYAPWPRAPSRSRKCGGHSSLSHRTAPYVGAGCGESRGLPLTEKERNLYHRDRYTSSGNNKPHHRPWPLCQVSTHGEEIVYWSCPASSLHSLG